MNEAEKAAEELSIERLRAQDRDEFARLVDMNYPGIYRLALRMMSNPQDAEDVLQETFLKAYRHLPEFDGRSKVSTWLYRIATNEALMVLRRRKPAEVSLEVPLEVESGEQVPLEIVDWCCLPEDELLTSEARRHLNQAIAYLPYSLRVVFVLRDIEGFSTQETGEVLDISETAVKTRLSRARLRLREDLSQYYRERSLYRSARAGDD